MQFTGSAKGGMRLQAVVADDQASYRAMEEVAYYNIVGEGFLSVLPSVLVK